MHWALDGNPSMLTNYVHVCTDVAQLRKEMLYLLGLTKISLKQLTNFP